MRATGRPMLGNHDRDLHPIDLVEDREALALNLLAMMVRSTGVSLI